MVTGGESDKNRNKNKNSVKLYTIESMKVSEFINPNNKTSFNIMFTSDHSNSIHV
jgi:hypothetical protein